MKLYMVIGVGPNGLEIPLVPFLDGASARRFISMFPKSPKGDRLDEDFKEVRGIYGDDNDSEGQSDLGKPLYAALFKNGYYYTGCGGVYKLIVKEVDIGQPMVAWDLD